MLNYSNQLHTHMHTSVRSTYVRKDTERSYDNGNGHSYVYRDILSGARQHNINDTHTFRFCLLMTCLSSSRQYSSSCSFCFLSFSSRRADSFLCRAWTAFEFSPLNFFGILQPMCLLSGHLLKENMQGWEKIMIFSNKSDFFD